MKTLLTIPLSLLLLIATTPLAAKTDTTSKDEQKQAKTYGTKKHGKLIHFADGMFRDGSDQIEIGQVIKLKKESIQVKSVKLYAFDSAMDNMDFKISFYKVENGRPTLIQIHKPIMQSQSIKEGWLTLDLSKYDLQINEDFVVALETERKSSDVGSLSYEVKPLANRHSYYRINGNKTWKRPPHRYCLQVVADVL
ncbi:hypothetical protein [Reichenbachiella sp. MSK19-1]|uniref:hypothetical protein n=1 Tax=Reichenbachiella sp. MSK19-1 TaxID=1897631 RepID=UPI000E6CA945|nr:hypothetical protein [Reichenbachiella sp. MSK19-1]RJE72591.1 hypothetical protein BGP76_01065 [Reichenbachiella sp. MSK19-1]